MKKIKFELKSFYFVAMFCLLSFSLYAGDLGSVDGHAVVFEKGDAIYRKGKTPPTNMEGHTGIFYEWPITETDTHDSSQYSTIEALGIGLPVSKNNIAKFLSDGAAFWGVRTANLTRLQRAIIAGTAKNQIGIKFHSLWGYKKPGISFRCDGLVEYCYEMVGVDLVPGDTCNPSIAAFPGRNFITPKNQMNSPLLSERTSAEVETVEIERVLQNGELIEPDGGIYYVYDSPITDIVTIEVNVSDGNYGSGIRMTDFWVGAPDDTPDIFEGNNSGKRIEIDAHPETVGGIYKANWNIDEEDGSDSPFAGAYTLHILAYDQAGNREDISIGVCILLPVTQTIVGGCIAGLRYDVYCAFNLFGIAWSCTMGSQFEELDLGRMGACSGGELYAGVFTSMGLYPPEPDYDFCIFQMRNAVWQLNTSIIPQENVLKTYVKINKGASGGWISVNLARDTYFRVYNASGKTVVGLNEWKTSNYSQCPEKIITGDFSVGTQWEIPQEMINYSGNTYLGLTTNNQVSEAIPSLPSPPCSDPFDGCCYVEGIWSSDLYPAMPQLQLIFILKPT